MAATVTIQAGQLYEQPDFKITVTQEGIWKLSNTYLCQAASIVQCMPASFSPHGTYTFCLLAEIVATRIEGDLAQIDCSYTGIPGGGESTHLIEVIGATTEEPIETNKLFNALTSTDFIAVRAFLTQTENSASTPLPTGTSDDATVAKLCQKKLKGTDSYLGPATTMRETWSTISPSLDLTGVGQITGAPPAGSPSLPEGCTWLLTNKTIKRNGGIYEVSREFRMSGPLGWDTDLYSGT